MRREFWLTISLLIGLLLSPATTHATVLQSYTVQPGDTLYSIAIENETTVSQLLHLNPDIIDANDLVAGQHIHLQEILTEDIALNTVQTAEALIGKTSSTDTSFLYNILKRNGIHVQTLDRQTLLTKGTFIEKSELKPGDIVFYSVKKHPSFVSHAALYAGEGKIIHAVDGYVRMDIMDLADKSYETARRVIE